MAPFFSFSIDFSIVCCCSSGEVGMDAGVVDFEWIWRPHAAAKQGLENVGRLLRRVDAFAVVARYEVGAAASAARSRLQVGETGFHARDLPLDLAALGGRFGAEEQELLVVAADRTGVGAGA